MVFGRMNNSTGSCCKPQLRTAPQISANLNSTATVGALENYLLARANNDQPTRQADYRPCVDY